MYVGCTVPPPECCSIVLLMVAAIWPYDKLDPLIMMLGIYQVIVLSWLRLEYEFRPISSHPEHLYPCSIVCIIAYHVSHIGSNQLYNFNLVIIDDNESDVSVCSMYFRFVTIGSPSVLVYCLFVHHYTTLLHT